MFKQRIDALTVLMHCTLIETRDTMDLQQDRHVPMHKYCSRQHLCVRVAPPSTKLEQCALPVEHDGMHTLLSLTLMSAQWLAGVKYKP